MSGNNSPERAARAALAAVVEPGSAVVMYYVHTKGAEETWKIIQSGGNRDLDPNGTLQRRAESVDGDTILRHLQPPDTRFICPGDQEWPKVFDVLDSSTLMSPDPVPPPLALWVRGQADLSEIVENAVAVVGARTATSYGQRVASDMAADLAIAGWSVVSGAAFGIDAAAHRGALALGGTTIAVLACGVDVPYPRSHAGLLERISSQGAVISEVPPGTLPMKQWFLARNRLIAALSSATVVVEAGNRSGALNTAAWANKLSCDVLAVPGPVSSTLSAGCHSLMRDKGAILTTHARDILEVVETKQKTL